MLAPDYQTPERMAAKLAAIRLPEFAGKRVLDVGCDFGFWCALAAKRSAIDVLGLDRNRSVRGAGPVDLIEMNRAVAQGAGLPCRFEKIEIGKQWREFGLFDIVFVMSVYHHIFEAAGGYHEPVWFWLWRHCAPDAVLIWEGPVDDTDPVVCANVSAAYRDRYTVTEIIAAAEGYFQAEYIGPALHEPTREVWRFRPRRIERQTPPATMQSGAGGATAAFLHAGSRRIAEIENALGARPVAGSLNLMCAKPFDWRQRYYRAEILDVRERGKGLDVEWAPRWARFYPVEINNIPAFAFRFEGEGYDDRFIELIADCRLRDTVTDPVTLKC